MLQIHSSWVTAVECENVSIRTKLHAFTVVSSNDLIRALIALCKRTLGISGYADL